MSYEICQECYSNAPLHHDLNLCENCYRALFNELPKEEPDFELKHDIAVISSGDPETNMIYAKLHDGSLVKVETGGIIFNKPKRYIFNPDARVKDYDKLVLFLLENFSIYENTKGFNNVKHMFKEVE